MELDVAAVRLALLQYVPLWKIIKSRKSFLEGKNYLEFKSPLDGKRVRKRK